MYINKGGELYGFCPAKATWDHSLAEFFRMLVVVAELKQLPEAGGVYDQNPDMVDMLSWFLPKYDFMKFNQKADMILGGDNKSNGKLKSRNHAKPRSSRVGAKRLRTR